MKRNDWILQDGEYHLTVLGVVRRRDGKFLITRRVMTKAWAPGWWEVSGGGVMAGESSEEAVKREVQEETGLDMEKFDREYLFTYHRENPGKGDNYFVDVYRFTGDFTEEDVTPQPEETWQHQMKSGLLQQRGSSFTMTVSGQPSRTEVILSFSPGSLRQVR